MKDEASIAQAVYDFVRARTELPCEFGSLPASRESLPCVSVQTLTGDPVTKRYKSGAYIGNYRFAVYLRQSAEDNAARLDSSKVLTDLATSIDGATVTLPASFVFWGLEQDTLPVGVTVDTAYEDWQATFTLTYKKG
jgi:hypothetical protein